MSNRPVVPAVIPISRDHVVDSAHALRFSAELQLDLVDGMFVESVSWPYKPLGQPMSVKSSLDLYTLEVDMMVVDQITAAKQWEDVGADMLVFHIEKIELDAFKNFTKDTKVSVGVSAHGDTSLDTLSKYAEFADYIQLMGIYQVGAQGLPFDEAVLIKIPELKRRFPELPISIDGSVNKDTIVSLKEAGADRFICGSAIVQQTDPEVAWLELCSLVND